MRGKITFRIEEQKFSMQLTRHYIHPQKGNKFCYIGSLVLLCILNILLRSVVLTQEIVKTKKMKEERKPLNRLWCISRWVFLRTNLWCATVMFLTDCINDSSQSQHTIKHSKILSVIKMHVNPRHLVCSYWSPPKVSLTNAEELKGMRSQWSLKSFPHLYNQKILWETWKGQALLSSFSKKSLREGNKQNTLLVFQILPLLLLQQYTLYRQGSLLASRDSYPGWDIFRRQ